MVPANTSLEYGYMPVTEASQQAKISAEMHWYLSYVCSTKLLVTPVMLGGRGVVQIDKSLRLTSSTWGCELLLVFVFTQDGRGRQQQWVFGMVDTSTHPSVQYMELVW